MTSQQNSMWIYRVRKLLKLGFGVEDIALREKCDVECVRAEVAILRESGELSRIYRLGEK
jgi:hypothetical protein